MDFFFFLNAYKSSESMDLIFANLNNLQNCKIWRKCDAFSVGFMIITVNENAIWMMWLVARYQISNMSFWTLISDSLGVQVLIYLLSWIITKKWHFESVKKYWYLNVYTEPRSYSMKSSFKNMDLIFCNFEKDRLSRIYSYYHERKCYLNNVIGRTVPNK